MLKSNLLSLNLEILKDAISAYKKEYGTDPLFIVMNEDTERELRNSSKDVFKIFYYEDFKQGHRKGNIKYSSFWEIPIAICNKLNFGEINVL